MTLDKSTCLKFYKRKEVQEAIVAQAQRKEVGVRYNETFGKRPDVLAYPRDVIELALRNVTSFHCSEELWSNPMALNGNLSKKEVDDLRIGWDLVLDIDCKFLDYSKICANLIIKFLQYCEVKDVSVKFSGNKGFHLGIPFEAFPQKVGNVFTKDLFPEAPRKIAAYVKENIKEELGKQILAFEKNNFNAVREKVELKPEEIIRYERNEFGDKVAKLDVDKFLEIDTILISSRHLYRMPYSLHEKSGLVSLPLDPNKVMEFEKSMAAPEKIILLPFVFLDRNVSGESGRRLLVQAWDFEAKMEKEPELKNPPGEEMKIESPLREEFFPPCLKLMLRGMEDGKKRSIFCLSNFLGKIGWSKKDLEEYLQRWNQEKNREPLREVYIKRQMNNFKAGEKLPPNCDNESYYKGLGVCQPDTLCARIKNPVNYTLLKWKRLLREKAEEEEKPKRKKKEKEEPKEKIPHHNLYK